VYLISMKKLFIILSAFYILQLHAQKNVGFSGTKGSYTFSKPFKTIRDIPRFSEWDSLPNGKWKQLYEGGQVAIEYTMKKYLLNGPAKGYYPDGSLRYEFTMNGNYIDGEFKEYYPSGKIWRLYNYFEGFLNGEWFMYYEDGTKHAQGDHKEDRKVGKLYHWWPNGNMKEERTYVNDTVNGMSVSWFETGIKMMEGKQFPADYKVGAWTFWWENGAKQRESEFIGGVELVHNAWNRLGQPMIVDGQGKYTVLSVTGDKLIEGYYKDSYQEGLWLYWDEKNLRTEPRKIQFKKGKKDN
jgi:hypothetical protein